MSDSEKSRECVHELIKLSVQAPTSEQALSRSQAALNCANAIAILENVGKGDGTPDWVTQLRDNLQSLVGK